MGDSSAPTAPRRPGADEDAGFSLIELLVVVIVIGVLAAIAIPSYVGSRNSARDAAVRSDVVNAKIALTAYSAAHDGAAPSTVTNGVTDDFVDLKPLGWTRGEATTALTYTRSSSSNAGWCVLAVSGTGARFVVTADSRVGGGASSTACPSTF